MVSAARRFVARHSRVRGHDEQKRPSRSQAPLGPQHPKPRLIPCEKPQTERPFPPATPAPDPRFGLEWRASSSRARPCCASRLKRLLTTMSLSSPRIRSSCLRT
ncbi:hypothetical protein [Lysobacter gummosus]|uniref:hypothetical protein n=1 Tax=Lysobacter gummosus TaxID=262324 RepID=UPI003627A60E